MGEQRRVGMLTPSSNTVLEPFTAAMFATLGETASVHFSRFRVVEIALTDASQAQFSDEHILEAAERLAEAKVHAIAWNGTSAAWLGLARDRALCARIEAACRTPATSTMLAYDAYFEAKGVRRLGLVTPYLADVQRAIVENFAARGIEVVAERHLGDPGNFSFANYGADEVAALVREVAAHEPDAVAVVCTNFRGATVAPALEAETGVPVLDSVALTAAATMKRAGLDPSVVTQWGSVFADFAAIEV